MRREREILEQLCLGATAKQIAAELEVSASCVNSHIGRMCRRAQATRTELVIYALQHPQALRKNGKCTPGLHPLGCKCESPYCEGMRRVA